MPRPRPEALSLADAYRLGPVSVPRGGPAGQRLGRGTGASLELEDRRAYAPGDDVRHLDWRAYARTDQLYVQVYREEVQPRVEVLLDVSASMAVEEDKAQRAVDVAALFLACARAEGSAAVLFAFGDAPRQVPFDALLARGLEFDALTPLGDALRQGKALLRPRAVRIVISDFLFPHDADGLVRELGSNAGALGAVQVLGAFDRNPTEGAALRLTDSERQTTADLVLDAPTVAAYRKRLGELGAALNEGVRRRGGAFCSPDLAHSLEFATRETLVPSGLLAPA